MPKPFALFALATLASCETSTASNAEQIQALQATIDALTDRIEQLEGTSSHGTDGATSNGTVAGRLATLEDQVQAIRVSMGAPDKGDDLPLPRGTIIDSWDCTKGDKGAHTFTIPQWSAPTSPNGLQAIGLWRLLKTADGDEQQIYESIVPGPSQTNHYSEVVDCDHQGGIVTAALYIVAL